MEPCKKEKINPLAGCLPILVQIPVFFSLYKELFVTIEMRHAPCSVIQIRDHRHPPAHVSSLSPVGVSICAR